MNKVSLLVLSITSLFSISSYAVEGGASISWDNYPYIVESQCTGTVLAGKYVMLAGHCALGALRSVNLSSGSSIMPIYRNTLYNSDLSEAGYADIALWTLSNTAPMNKIAFIDDLNNATNTPQLNDEVTVIGFGQNDSVPRLGVITNYINWLSTNGMGIGYDNGAQQTTNGDSGAPIFNIDNRIIATHYSAGGQGVNLRFVKD